MVYIHSFKEQSWLLPPSIEYLIPEDHICILVENLIESLDFSSFDIRYNGLGHPAYHPRILLKLLVIDVHWKEEIKICKNEIPKCLRIRA